MRWGRPALPVCLEWISREEELWQTSEVRLAAWIRTPDWTRYLRGRDLPIRTYPATLYLGESFMRDLYSTPPVRVSRAVPFLVNHHRTEKEQVRDSS